MISSILYIYLTGFVITGSYGAYSCYKEGGNHVVAPEMCTVATTIGAMAWPVVVPATIYGEVKDRMKK